MLYEDMDNGLRLGIGVGFEKIANFDGAGLISGFYVLLASPD